MDLSDYSTTVHRGDTFCPDLWGRGCYPPRGKLPNTEDEILHPDNNDELLGKNLDLIDEQREKATIHLAYYHQKLKQGYVANVKLRLLAPRDLVLRKVVGVAKNPS